MTLSNPHKRKTPEPSSLPSLFQGLVFKTTSHASSCMPETAQLTIFYDGTISVFDNVTPHKAQAISILAQYASNSTMSKINQAGPERAYARRTSLARFLESRMQRIKRSPGSTSSLTLEEEGL